MLVHCLERLLFSMSFFSNIIASFFKSLQSTQIIITYFLLTIFIGAFLLMLPVSIQNNETLTFIDALFTSTSAVCVTGLTVVDTLEHWTYFGKIIILLLVQVGGLGLMTVVTTFFIFWGKKITLKERLIIQQSLNQNNLSGVVRHVKSIFFITLIIESIAGFLMSIRFISMSEMPFGMAVFMGIFHSVTAFCSAGFDLLSSYSPYTSDIIINVIIVIVTFIGSLGYTVWLDVFNTFKTEKLDNKSFKNYYPKLTLHTKIVLEYTLGIVVFGSIFFFFAEYSNPYTIGEFKFTEKLFFAVFQSSSSRTSGFNTLPQAGMEYASQFMSMIFMFIGGSPGSTSGGIKTVTLAIIIVSVISVIKGSNSIVYRNRSIHISFLQKALAIVIMNLILIIVSVIILSFTEKSSYFTPMEVLFEVVSAVSTGGLSLGITSNLSDLGKIIICICMFVGRLGTVTIAVALTLKQVNSSNITYPEEKILI